MLRNHQLRFPLFLASCLLLAALTASVDFAAGQFGRVKTVDFASGVHLPSDRRLTRSIHEAKQRIAAGEYSQAIRFLDEVLAQPEDTFVDLKEDSQKADRALVGLKRTAQTILRELPEEGRRVYLSTYGPEAKRMLRTAIAAGDAEKIAEVASRFFYTPAGHEASLLLAGHQADLGHPLAATLIYEQLLKTPSAVELLDPQLSISAVASWLAVGQTERAEQQIESLRQQGHRSVRIAGEQVSLDLQNESGLQWFSRVVGVPALSGPLPEQHWLTHRGNPARNGQTDGGLPHLRVHWQSRLLFHHSRLETACDAITLQRQRKGQALPVAAIPLAAGDYVIARSAQNLMAIDFRTGKLVWQAESQRLPAMEKLVHAAAMPGAEDARTQATHLFAQRIWEDYLYNTISSDGQRVFVIHDLQFPNPYSYGHFGLRAARRRRPGLQTVGGTNRLCAYDLATVGKRVWEIDGANQQGEMAGTFFLGAPLAVGQSLYCLCEASGVISLTALDRATGDFQWRQPLVNLEIGILLDANRRLQASMPSYDAGILVCPTGAGVVVGVDLAQRSLAWAYRYDRKKQSFPGKNTGETHWRDSSITLAEGRVLLTPPESNSLHCLDLVTGKRLWKRERGQLTHLACVDRGRILLVGNHHLTALQLSDGESAWTPRTVQLPSTPSGRGFLSDGKYHLPFSTAEVAAVEVETGQIVARSVSQEGHVLGNLICHRGAVLSQNGGFLEKYDQVEVLRKRSEKVLANQPDDVVALRTLGDIAYSQGDVAKAIDLLQQAYQADPSDGQTRSVLGECLVTALDEDFATFQQRLPLLEQLHPTSGAQQLAILRVQAKGLLEIGQPIESLDICVRMFRAARELTPMLSIGKHRQVQVSRWLSAQTLAIWDAASEDQRTLITKRLTEIQQQQASQTNTDLLRRRFADCFGELPSMEPMWMERACRLVDEKQPLAAQQIFLRLASSSQESLRNEATARMAQGLHRAGLHRQALHLDRQLGGPLAEVVCMEGKTGSECLAAWKVSLPKDGADEKGAFDWPRGKVEVATISSNRAETPQRLRLQLMGIPLEQCDSVLGSGNVLFSQSTGDILARDSYGKEFFRGATRENRRVAQRVVGSPYGVARGNLLLVSLGRQIVAFDTLADDTTPSGLSSDASKKLWSYNVISALEDRYSHRSLYRKSNHFRAPRSQLDGQWVGVIGPVTHNSCIVEAESRLICIDPLTGKVQWTRTDVPTGCDLYGDDRVVLVVPRTSRKAEIFSVQDGRRLGSATVPRWEEQVATRGRSILRWRSQANGERELSAVDGPTGKVAWQHDFHSLAKIDVAMGRFVAAVEPSGRCVIVDGQNGEIIVDQTFEENPRVNEIHLLAGSDHFILVTSNPPQATTGRGRLTGIRGLTRWDYPVVRGLVYVLDRQTGQPVWSRPAKLHQQALMLTQPLDLPMIVFAGILPQQGRQGTRSGISMLLLNKATGGLLFKNSSLPNSGGGYCVARSNEEDPHVVTVEMAIKTIRLKFTDDTDDEADDPPVVYEEEVPAKESSGGLLQIFRKLSDGI